MAPALPRPGSSQSETEIEAERTKLDGLAVELTGISKQIAASSTDDQKLVAIKGRLDAISREIARLFEAGCDEGDLLACSQFGFRLELGDGTALDVARAQTLYRRACEGGEPQGCSYLGEIYRSGLGVRPDLAEAVRFFALGCDGNDPYACVTLGDILSDGRGVGRDVPRALVALERACGLGDPEACDMADTLR